jgi:hypothetical protein
MTTKDIFKKIFYFLTVIKKGNSLQDPQFWKSLQLLLTALASIVPIIAPFYAPLAQFLEAGGFEKLITATGAMNLYFTASTSEKIGV